MKNESILLILVACVFLVSMWTGASFMVAKEQETIKTCIEHNKVWVDNKCVPDVRIGQ